jgi:hypothetical protein
LEPDRSTAARDRHFCTKTKVPLLMAADGQQKRLMQKDLLATKASLAALNKQTSG